MKNVFVLLLLLTSAFAQEHPVASCGPKEVDFDVKLDESQHLTAMPEAGKARVYFAQDMGPISCIGNCMRTRIGVDGAWVGAVQRNSYFSIVVEPGEHHLCVSPETKMTPSASPKYAGVLLAFAHFTAEAGKVYYFRTRRFNTRFQEILEFGPIDSDQGRFLIEYYPLSISHPKP